MLQRTRQAPDFKSSSWGVALIGTLPVSSRIGFIQKV